MTGATGEDRRQKTKAFTTKTRRSTQRATKKTQDKEKDQKREFRRTDHEGNKADVVSAPSFVPFVLSVF
jgi:hypothetical protein